MKEKRILPLDLNNYKPLGETIFEALREAIISRVLAPGERLMEVQLAEEMGVSRTPVREAIRKLETEGFVVIEPRKGAYVATFSADDVRELYEIRGALEALAGSLAAKRATPEELKEMERLLLKENNYISSDNVFDTVDTDVGLHELIYRAARNERLLTTLNNLRGQLYRTRSASMSIPGRKEKTMEEHRQIIEAITARNPEEARRLMYLHVANAEKAVITYLKGLNESQEL